MATNNNNPTVDGRIFVVRPPKFPDYAVGEGNKKGGLKGGGGGGGVSKKSTTQTMGTGPSSGLLEDYKVKLNASIKQLKKTIQRKQIEAEADAKGALRDLENSDQFFFDLDTLKSFLDKDTKDMDTINKLLRACLKHFINLAIASIRNTDSQKLIRAYYDASMDFSNAAYNKAFYVLPEVCLHLDRNTGAPISDDRMAAIKKDNILYSTQYNQSLAQFDTLFHQVVGHFKSNIVIESLESVYRDIILYSYSSPPPPTSMSMPSQNETKMSIGGGMFSTIWNVSTTGLSSVSGGLLRFCASSSYEDYSHRVRVGQLVHEDMQYLELQARRFKWNKEGSMVNDSQLGRLDTIAHIQSMYNWYDVNQHGGRDNRRNLLNYFNAQEILRRRQNVMRDHETIKDLLIALRQLHKYESDSKPDPSDAADAIRKTAEILEKRFPNSRITKQLKNVRKDSGLETAKLPALLGLAKGAIASIYFLEVSQFETIYFDFVYGGYYFDNGAAHEVSLRELEVYQPIRQYQTFLELDDEFLIHKLFELHVGTILEYDPKAEDANYESDKKKFATIVLEYESRKKKLEVDRLGKTELKRLVSRYEVITKQFEQLTLVYNSKKKTFEDYETKRKAFHRTVAERSISELKSRFMPDLIARAYYVQVFDQLWPDYLTHKHYEESYKKLAISFFDRIEETFSSNGRSLTQEQYLLLVYLIGLLHKMGSLRNAHMPWLLKLLENIAMVKDKDTVIWMDFIKKAKREQQTEMESFTSLEIQKKLEVLRTYTFSQLSFGQKIEEAIQGILNFVRGLYQKLFTGTIPTTILIYPTTQLMLTNYHYVVYGGTFLILAALLGSIFMVNRFLGFLEAIPPFLDAVVLKNQMTKLVKEADFIGKLTQDIIDKEKTRTGQIEIYYKHCIERLGEFDTLLELYEKDRFPTGTPASDQHPNEYTKKQMPQEKLVFEQPFFGLKTRTSGDTSSVGYNLDARSVDVNDGPFSLDMEMFTGLCFIGANITPDVIRFVSGPPPPPIPTPPPTLFTSPATLTPLIAPPPLPTTPAVPLLIAPPPPPPPEIELIELQNQAAILNASSSDNTCDLPKAIVSEFNNKCVEKANNWWETCSPESLEHQLYGLDKIQTLANKNVQKCIDSAKVFIDTCNQMSLELDGKQFQTYSENIEIHLDLYVDAMEKLKGGEEYLKEFRTDKTKFFPILANPINLMQEVGSIYSKTIPEFLLKTVPKGQSLETHLRKLTIATYESQEKKKRFEPKVEDSSSSTPLEMFHELRTKTIPRLVAAGITSTPAVIRTIEKTVEIGVQYAANPTAMQEIVTKIVDTQTKKAGEYIKTVTEEGGQYLKKTTEEAGQYLEKKVEEFGEKVLAKVDEGLQYAEKKVEQFGETIVTKGQNTLDYTVESILNYLQNASAGVFIRIIKYGFTQFQIINDLIDAQTFPNAPNTLLPSSITLPGIAFLHEKDTLQSISDHLEIMIKELSTSPEGIFILINIKPQIMAMIKTQLDLNALLLEEDVKNLEDLKISAELPFQVSLLSGLTEFETPPKTPQERLAWKNRVKQLQQYMGNDTPADYIMDTIMSLVSPLIIGSVVGSTIDDDHPVRTAIINNVLLFTKHKLGLNLTALLKSNSFVGKRLWQKPISTDLKLDYMTIGTTTALISNLYIALKSVLQSIAGYWGIFDQTSAQGLSIMAIIQSLRGIKLLTKYIDDLRALTKAGLTPRLNMALSGVTLLQAKMQAYDVQEQYGHVSHWNKELAGFKSRVEQYKEIILGTTERPKTKLRIISEKAAVAEKWCSSPQGMCLLSLTNLALQGVNPVALTLTGASIVALGVTTYVGRRGKKSPPTTTTSATTVTTTTTTTTTPTTTRDTITPQDRMYTKDLISCWVNMRTFSPDTHPIIGFPSLFGAKLIDYAPPFLMNQLHKSARFLEVRNTLLSTFGSGLSRIGLKEHPITMKEYLEQQMLQKTTLPSSSPLVPMMDIKPEPSYSSSSSSSSSSMDTQQQQQQPPSPPQPQQEKGQSDTYEEDPMTIDTDDFPPIRPLTTNPSGGNGDDDDDSLEEGYSPDDKTF